MNRTLIVVGIVVVLIVFGGILFFMSGTANQTPQTSSNTTTGNTNPFPIAGSGQTSGNSSNGENTTQGSVMYMNTTDGQAITVPDFTTGHPNYQLQSGTYYQVTQDKNGNEENTDFSIVLGTDSSIAIGLLAEPLGQARLDAETRLRQLFPGVSDSTLCKLHVTVFASPDVNENYAGEELGLSFCPGATKLP